MSYILRGRWCHITVLNVHAPTEDKTDDVDSFYEELERVFGNDCYHSVQNLLSSCLLSNLKIRIYKTIILPVVLYGCET
jgi:hypothetical protein